ncbi:RNA polymerase II-specific transcription factor-like protein [Microdochium nivale]|nr:RNA polymerase II-specific transcription factor-like protein [Microdochium nivale]
MAKTVSPSTTTACEQCRCRKIKCDKTRPSCGTCQKNGLECFFIQEKFRRGPKKGELSRLKAQVEFLEQRLATQQKEDQRNSPEFPEPGSVVATNKSSESGLDIHVENDDGSRLLGEVDQDSGHTWEPSADSSFMEWLDLTLSSQNLGFQAASPVSVPSLPLNPIVPAGLVLDNLTTADL